MNKNIEKKVSVELTVTDKKICIQNFKNAKIEASKAARELWTSEGQEHPENYVFLDDYANNVIKEINELVLPKVFSIEQFKSIYNKIGMIMNKANNNFNWNDPRLDEMV